MNKKKVITIILILVLVLVAIFLTSTIRKMIILKDLNQKVAQYTNSKNYYEKIVNSAGTTVDYYCKGDNAVLFLNSNASVGEKRNLINYFKGNITNTYIESGKDKIAILNSNGLPSKVTIIGLDVTDNFGQLFGLAVTTSIKNIEYNGKDCYVLNLGKSDETYIEKETGLRIKAKEGTITDEKGNVVDSIVEYYYEFDNVDDSIFVEPDISQYTVEKKN